LDIAISDKQLLLLQAEKLSQEYTAPTGHSATALNVEHMCDGIITK